MYNVVFDTHDRSCRTTENFSKDSKLMKLPRWIALLSDIPSRNYSHSQSDVSLDPSYLLFDIIAITFDCSMLVVWIAELCELILCFLLKKYDNWIYMWHSLLLDASLSYASSYWCLCMNATVHRNCHQHSLVMHKSDSQLRSCSRERHDTLEESKQLRYSRHKSHKERPRSRDARRDTSHPSASNYYRRFSSRSRSNSPCRNIRQDDSIRRQSSHACDIHIKNIPAELKLITYDARYYLLKSNNFDNLLLAKAESVWSTPPQNEARINSAFKVCKYLFVSYIFPSLEQLCIKLIIVWQLTFTDNSR